MSKPIEEQVAELEEAISVQEGLRDSLGDEVVNSTVDALREKLEALKSSRSEERKLVTCLFCDLVGSTQMAADRDPEEVLQIIDGALKEMSAAVEAFGGNVARYMGDGILAFFGAPRALEAHAEQAILAGIDIQARIADYAKEVEAQYGLDEFQARVGINSGYVVAGHVAGAQGEYTVIGDTINVASRIEQASPPGSVLVGESTYRLAGGESRFDSDAWGEIQMKGQTQPLEVFEVRSQSESAAPSGLTTVRGPLAGRSAELNELQQQYGYTISKNTAQFVAIIGEAGIGKTRMRQEFAGWLAKNDPEAVIWLGRAFSYTRQSPYALASSLLKSALAINESDNADQRRAKLEAGWSSLGDLSVQDLHGLAAVLALDYPEDSLAGLEPQARRNAIFDAFSALFSRRAKTDRLVLILEDTHWADDVSIDLIEYLLQNAADSPLFGLMLTRPAEEAVEGAQSFTVRTAVGPYKKIRLRDLTPEQTARMVQSLLSTEQVPSSVVELIVQVTEGNPFFVEEVLNSLIEEGTLEAANGDWKLAAEGRDLHVPETVQGVLAARIDRLDAELKGVLQHAAIIGRTFWQELLAELLKQPVEAPLNRLSEQEFVQRQGRDAVVQDWEWIFRHVLVQEVAYDSVLKQLRREVHTKIGDWLADQAADRLDELAPLLAHHYEAGQSWDMAIEYMVRAAERSRNLYALNEAIGFLDRAAELGSKSANDLDPGLSERIYELRGEIRGLAGEFDGALEDYGLVLSSARKAGDKSKEQATLVSMGMVYRRADDYDHAMAHLKEAIDVARSAGDRKGMADALYHLGSVAWSVGDNVRSTEYHQEAVDITRELGLEDLVAVQAYHGRAEAYWFSGLPQDAIEMFEESLRLAEQIGDKSYESENNQMLGMMYSGHFGVADYDKAREYAAKSLAINEEANLHWHEGPALFTLALGLMGIGDYEGARNYALRGEALAKEIGALRLLAIGLAFEGIIYQQLNLNDRAEAAHAEGLKVSREIGSEFNVPLILAGLAIDRMRQGDLDVEDLLNSAVRDARERDQLVFATRALEGLAEHALSVGNPHKAVEHAAELNQIAERGGLREFIGRSLMWSGRAQLSLDDRSTAEKTLRRALKIAEEINAPRLLWKVHESLAELYLASDNAQLKEQHDKAVQEVIHMIAANLNDPELKRGLPLN